MAVGSFCHRPARTITPGESVLVAARWMDEQRVGALVVVEGARPVGMLTDRDVALRVLAEGRDASATEVRELAADPPATLPEDLPLAEASARMARLGLRRMPVVGAEGNVVGVLAADDLVRVVSDELVALADVASEQVPKAGPPVEGAVRDAQHFAKEVVHVGVEASAREIAQRMHSEAVGSVVVVDGAGAPVGIVTDRDLATRVVAGQLDPDTATATSVMSGQLATIDAGERLQHAARRMSERGVRRIPVVREGRLVGIVTYDDLLVALGRELRDLGTAARTAIQRERVSAHAEEVRREVAQAVEALGERLEHLEEEARGALRRHLDSLRDWAGAGD